MGLGDEDRRRLENEILNNPKSGTIIRGTCGLRKIRFGVESKGKSGGLRVLFVDFIIINRIYLVTAYPKSKKENISLTERAMYEKMIEQTKRQLGG